MSYKQQLRSLFQKKKEFKVEEGHVITPVFISGGVQYYQLHDIFNSFCARAMDALSVYEQWGMRCTKTFLEGHVEAVKAALSDPKRINIVDIVNLNNKIKERLDWAVPSEELIWKFAAVAYFDESESPYKYDNKYGEDKIARWKKNNDIDDFFLFGRIKGMIPCTDISDEDLKTYLNTVNKMSKLNYDQVIGILSSNPQSKDLLTRLQSEKSLLLTRAN